MVLQVTLVLLRHAGSSKSPKEENLKISELQGKPWSSFVN